MKQCAISMVIAVCFFLVPLAVAQQQKNLCDSPIKYESRNQVDPPPLSVSVVSGRVINEVGALGDSPKEVGPVDGACIGLFTEKDHQLIASTNADDEGRFRLNKVPVGRYRLVVRAGSLCVANVPLRVIRGARDKAGESRQLVIHMRAAGIDTCSYGDYK